MKSALFVALLLSGTALAMAPAARRVASADEVCSAARQAVRAEAVKRGLDATVDCPNAVALDVPGGPIAWALVTERINWVSGATRVVLRAVGDADSVPRDLAVPVVLTLASKAWVARRQLAVGEAISENDVEWRDVRWPTGVSPQPAASAPTGRARTVIRAGDVVVASRLTPSGERLQGDAVTVAFRTEGFVLEMPALLAANAQIGHPARAQLKGRRETIEGVLVDADTVVVEH